MLRSILFPLTSLVLAIGMMGCTQSKDTQTGSYHNEVCAHYGIVGLRDTAKHFKSKVTKFAKEDMQANCDCLTKGLATILTAEQYAEMETLMRESGKNTAMGARNDYLKSLMPRGTSYKDYPFVSVKSSCKEYMKVWRNSYSSHDVYTPPPPF